MARKPKPPKREPAKSTPGKFTPEVCRQILNAVEGGLFRFQACAIAGINRGTLRDWELRAEQEPGGEHAEFVSELDRVQAAAEGRLQAIHYALSTGGKLPDKAVSELTGELADMRQRAFLPALQAQLKYGGSRPWAEIQRLEHTGKDGAPLEMGVAKVVLMPPKDPE